MLTKHTKNAKMHKKIIVKHTRNAKTGFLKYNLGVR
jgi:hypothetical protein